MDWRCLDAVEPHHRYFERNSGNAENEPAIALPNPRRHQDSPSKRGYQFKANTPE
jgi:hypothetical protein